MDKYCISKCFYLLLSAFFAVVLIVACKKDNSWQINQQSKSSYSDYFVDYHLVEDFFMRNNPHTRGEFSSQSSSILPFSFRNETVFYIVNFPDNQGWQIVSSDQRTPAILAESPHGSFSLDTDNAGLYAWMIGIAEDMYAVRHAANTDLSFSEEEISCNTRFWSKEPSRSLDPHPEDDGAWVGTSTTVTEVYDTIPHLTSTQWAQRDPYNEYCPLTTNGTGRAPAGCVAVAGAQMLYYLHDKWGVPEYMESSAYCSGYVGTGNYIMTQWNPTNTVWDDMITSLCYGSCSHYHPESVMIARVGWLIGANYDNDGTSASMDNLVDDVFNLYDIDCDYGSYSENAVKNSLLSGLPVIVGASRQWYPNWDFNIPGHAFLIDGYKRTRIKTTTHYTFIPNDPENYDPSTHPSYDVITYSSPEITSVKMNWGWRSQWYPNYRNDGWYTLTGDWIVELNGNQVNYHYYRRMINNFSVIE